MPGFDRFTGVIEGQAEVLELVSTGEGGEDTFEFEIPEDTEALLIVTEGEGGARLIVGESEIGQLATPTALSVVNEGRVQVYIDTDPRPATGRLTLWYGSGQRLVGRIIRFTKKPGRWIKEQIKKRGRCWTCKQIIRSILKALGGIVGIPDIPLLDDMIGEASGALENLVGDPARLPRPLRELLKQFFGQDWPEILREILRRIAQGPFGLIANWICEELGHCP